MKAKIKVKKFSQIKLKKIIFFYHKCDKCNVSFKKVKMWQVFKPIFMTYEYAYLCRHCAPSIEEACKYFGYTEQYKEYLNALKTFGKLKKK